jgi:uncharacterized protein YodC (DUF2158 family)
MKFKIGDVVRLKSGGPAMTVTATPDVRVRCSWFSGADEKHAYFPAAAVEPVAD